MEQNNLDYKKLIDEGRSYLRLEWDYGKLTALEKLTVLLSMIAVAAVVAVFGALALYFLASALVAVLATTLGNEWLAHLLVAALLLVIAAVVFTMRKQLIIDPISRFLTRLFLSEDGKQ